MYDKNMRGQCYQMFIVAFILLYKSDNSIRIWGKSKIPIEIFFPNDNEVMSRSGLSYIDTRIT